MEMGPVYEKFEDGRISTESNPEILKENQNHSIANVTIFIIIVIIPDNIGG